MLQTKRTGSNPHLTWLEKATSSKIAYSIIVLAVLTTFVQPRYIWLFFQCHRAIPEAEWKWLAVDMPEWR